jgi:uncharacterized protein YgbK (DUF1537 family)
MLAIIADDLTGALDTAAPFAGRGLHTQVVLTLDAIADALAQLPDVLSVNLGSREMTVQDAQQAVLTALSRLPPDAVLFKKVDSRLKGHIVGELDVIPFQSALMAPAIPDFERVVHAGHVRGFGVEVPIPVAEKLGRHAARVHIPDVSSAQEMMQQLQAAQKSGVDLLIGARGLAEALAQQVSGRASADLVDIPEGSGLFVIGSRDPITLAQIGQLRAECDLRYLPAPNGRLDNLDPIDSALTLVQAVAGHEAVASPDVSRFLADSVCPILTGPARTLVLSGGETAQAVLAAMGITRLRLSGECLPGLGVAYAEGHCIIAKSGGFGQPDALRVIADSLTRKVG